MNGSLDVQATVIINGIEATYAELPFKQGKVETVLTIPLARIWSDRDRFLYDQISDSILYKEGELGTVVGHNAAALALQESAASLSDATTPATAIRIVDVGAQAALAVVAGVCSRGGSELKARHLRRRWGLPCASTWRTHIALMGAMWNVSGSVAAHRTHAVRPRLMANDRAV